ncbi:oxidoreductase [Novacetimonas maltaceti]|uniref:D-beta-hydroxybutyrate dehydrogenase n=1 Tax=Novacetimonas maltaceti TaxID=1203393 RepID=A0A2S3VZI9_9PROT|nr:SDR family oxidoreductase [Novacetimonas maltaceti]POF62030.1 D-beta-hydroxybutyrate dehydrogenase [Novacetimonas maltaceti]PYD60398.1 oxidoreductase [Novacetimonas maltaceti]
MKIDLAGRTAIVTGSTGGIGLAIATGLAQCGARVVVNGRRAAAVDRAVATIAQAGGAAVGFVGDLGAADGCAALVAAHPSCDILVNNLGIFEPRDFFDTPDEDWTRFFEINVMSGVRLSRAYLPGMRERDWGRVIFISSESALNIPVEMIHYGFSKTAQVAIARGLAERMAGTNVTVNSVLPGPTLSEGLAEMLRPEQEKTGKTLEEVAADFVMEHRPSSIIRRAATVEEVANMVIYLASPLASATTGASVRVDGGVLSVI